MTDRVFIAFYVFFYSCSTIIDKCWRTRKVGFFTAFFILLAEKKSLLKYVAIKENTRSHSYILMIVHTYILHPYLYRSTFYQFIRKFLHEPVMMMWCDVRYITCRKRKRTNHTKKTCRLLSLFFLVWES